MIPQNNIIFPNKAIKIFIVGCILFWITGIVLLNTYGDHQLFTFINNNNNLYLDAIIPWITRLGELWGIVPMAFIPFLFYPKTKYKRLVILIILSNIVPMLINVSLKNIVAAHRPMFYYEQSTWLHFLELQPKQYNLSFPSGHTEGIFAIITTIVLLLPKKHAWLSLPLFIIALLVGYSRIYLVQHFFQDVLAGSMIGVVFAILTFAITNQYLRLKETKIGQTKSNN